MAEAVLDSISLKDAEGQTYPLLQLLRKVTLIVNVDCKAGGNTNNECAQLQELYTRHQERGFQILAFPCDQFQLRSDVVYEEVPDEIAKQVRADLAERFGVTFPVLGKVDVNGNSAHPLFQLLQKALPAFPTPTIKWDFTKFLIVGTVPAKRYGPTTAPDVVESDIIQALAITQSESTAATKEIASNLRGEDGEEFDVDQISHQSVQGSELKDSIFDTSSVLQFSEAESQQNDSLTLSTAPIEYLQHIINDLSRLTDERKSKGIDKGGKHRVVTVENLKEGGRHSKERRFSSVPIDYLEMIRSGKTLPAHDNKSLIKRKRSESHSATRANDESGPVQYLEQLRAGTVLEHNSKPQHKFSLQQLDDSASRHHKHKHKHTHKHKHDPSPQQPVGGEDLWVSPANFLDSFKLNQGVSQNKPEEDALPDSENEMDPISYLETLKAGKPWAFHHRGSIDKSYRLIKDESHSDQNSSTSSSTSSSNLKQQPRQVKTDPIDYLASLRSQQSQKRAEPKADKPNSSRQRHTTKQPMVGPIEYLEQLRSGMTTRGEPVGDDKRDDALSESDGGEDHAHVVKQHLQPDEYLEYVKVGQALPPILSPRKRRHRASKKGPSRKHAKHS